MSTKSYTFAVVPKRLDSPYWEVVKSGCEIRAKRLTKMLAPANVTCLFVGPSEGGPETEVNQKKIVEGESVSSLCRHLNDKENHIRLLANFY